MMRDHYDYIVYRASLGLQLPGACGLAIGNIFNVVIALLFEIVIVY